MPQRVHCAAALLVLVLAANVYGGYSRTQDFKPATPEELAMTKIEGMAEAPAAILHWVRIDDEQQAFSADYYRIKVFTEEGKKYADVEVPYFPAYPLFGRVAEIEARTIRPDGTIVPFDGKVYDKVLIKGKGMKVHAKTFTLPDVQPGSILEYRYSRRWANDVLCDTSWSLQHDIPLVKANLTLTRRKYTGYRSFYTYFGLPPGVAPKEILYKGFELEVQNIPAFQNEPYSPPENQLRAYVNFHYTSSRVKPEEFWPAEAHRWSDTIEDFIGKPEAVKSTAESLIGTDPRVTARKIYAYVQKLRNYSFESAKTEQELDKQSISAAKNAAHVLTKRAGFSDEINRTFVALARAAGLQASAMRVAPRDEFFFTMELLDAEQMAGEVAVVMLDGKEVFLDPGTPGAPFGVVSWEKTNTPGIKVAKGSPSEWLKVPAVDAKAAVVKRAAELKVNGETLEGTVTVTYRDQEALTRRLRSLGDEEAATKKAFEDEVKEWFADGASVKLTKLTGRDSFDDSLVATFDVALPNLVSTAGSRTLVPLSVFAANAPNPFAPATRRNPIYFEHPRTVEDEVKLTVPDSLQVSAVPNTTALNAGALGYKSEAAASTSSVTFRRSMYVDVMLIEAKNYNALRNFYSSVATADQKPLVLVAKP